jgi:hypothetical protein
MGQGRTSPNDFVIRTGGGVALVPMVTLVLDISLTKNLVTDSFATFLIAAIIIA